MALDRRAIGNSRYGNLRTFSDQRFCGVAASQDAARGDFRSRRVDQKVSIDVEPQV